MMGQATGRILAPQHLAAGGHPAGQRRSMARRKPNYRFERFERERTRAAKKADKAQAKADKAKRADPDAPPSEPDAPTTDDSSTAD
jgi:hypothetical protein